MSGRLIATIISTIAEEAATLYLGLWFLPRIDVNIPIPILLAIMLAWLAWSVFTYQKGTRALVRKPVHGLDDMKGMKGIVVRPLYPDGMVKIRGELWGGRSVTGPIESGTKVVVVAQDGLKLVVRAENSHSGTPSVDQ